MNGGRLKGLGVTAKRAGNAPQVPPIGDTVKDYAEIKKWSGWVKTANITPE